jgi:hypothetical protein
MADATVFLIPGAVLVLGLGIWAAIVAHRKEKARLAAMQAEATRRGWTYMTEDWSALDAPFGFLRQGERRTALQVVRGRDGPAAFQMFTYRFITVHYTHDKNGTHRHEEVHLFRVGLFPMPISAPNLSISKETFGKKVFDALGGEDIDFESDEFSRRFWVKCDDRKFAYDVLHPQAMEFMLGLDPNWTWQWSGPTLMLFLPGKILQSDWDVMLGMANGMAKLVPRHLLAASKSAGTWQVVG